ncbi:MAG: SoxX protein [Pseudomonadota bacterium]|jgi:sulfur-oxidizing protein SoxX
MKNKRVTSVFVAYSAIKRIAKLSTLMTGIALLASCASTTMQKPSAAEVLASIKASFAERGLAKLDRLDQTEIQKVCSESLSSGVEVPKATREKMEQAIYAAIPYPEDGKYIGDWKEGEKIAQNGRGLQFSDVAGAPNGANCYACHQLTPTEISFGNQGPSLLKYGTIRGVKDAASKDSEAIVKYTWARIWNTHSVNLCSNMPRFGDAGILTEQQVKHVMALLLDPQSPVNK